MRSISTDRMLIETAWARGFADGGAKACERMVQLFTAHGEQGRTRVAAEVWRHVDALPGSTPAHKSDRPWLRGYYAGYRASLELMTREFAGLGDEGAQAACRKAYNDAARVEALGLDGEA